MDRKVTSVKAGTVWKADGHTLEFMRDLNPGDFLRASTFKFDGEHPEVGERIDYSLKHFIDIRSNGRVWQLKDSVEVTHD